MRFLLYLLALAVCGPACAQTTVGSLIADVSPADVAAAIALATPSDCPAPLPDAMTASAGVQSKCMPRPDAVRATQVYPATATTTSDGSFTGTWIGGITLPQAPSRGTATIYGTTVPYHCQLASLSTTGFTGKCWALVTTTLPALASALPGLVISPFANPAAGLTVNIVARQ